MIDKKWLYSLGLASTLFVTSNGIHAQATPHKTHCGGNRNAVLQIIAVDNKPLSGGKELEFCLSGVPFSHICLIFDIGPGPTSIKGFGTFCLDFSRFIGFIGLMLPASGTGCFKFKLPPNIPKTLLCWQWVGVQPKILNRIDISNGICFNTGNACAKKLSELSHMTCFPTPKSFPVTVTTKYHDGKSESSGCAKSYSSWASVKFDPAKPPRFPITRDGITFIDKISIAAGKMCVMTRIVAGSSTLSSQSQLGSNTSVKVVAGTKSVCEEIHTSCSKPLGVGMKFGEVLITGLAGTRKGGS